MFTLVKWASQWYIKYDTPPAGESIYTHAGKTTTHEANHPTQHAGVVRVDIATD